ncbi:MAG: hypothetical protein HOD74_03905 [Verrucomicrobia bacterium]|nr:hypothetical protein [Verrucomicrobiota bacterium]
MVEKSIIRAEQQIRLTVAVPIGDSDLSPAAFASGAGSTGAVFGSIS